MKKQIILFLFMTVSLSSIGQISCTATSTDEYCGQSNGTAIVTPSGNCSTGFTYLWNTSPPQTTVTATNLPTGTYTVTVTCDTQTCTASATVNNIPGPSCVICNVVNDTNSLGQGSMTVCVSGGGGSYHYLWSDNYQQQTSVACCLTAGIYTVTVCDQYNCCCTTSGTIQDFLAIAETDKKEDISIFPNPTTGIFSIDFSNFKENNFLIELTDLIGKIVLTRKITDIKMTFDISTLSQGFYYLKIYNKRMILNKKILKE